jgi:putative ABC transport system ATP-binding protein
MAIQTRTTETTPILIRDLTKVYDSGRADLAVRAVDGISFRVERGESVAIIGPSGCGKSSLLNILGCLDRPTAGSYELDGRDMAALDDDELAALRNRHIGFVFQSFNLLPRMSAAENVELPLLYGAVKNSREIARIALERVGLESRAHHLPSELSGGQRQRVAIARAIVTRPSILLCDEPTGALDSRTGRDVIELLLSLNAEGATLVVVTHDLGIARGLSRAIRMKDGLIVADGNAASVVAEMHASELEAAC